MNPLEKEMLLILKDLKENFGVIGVKSEFEAEGTRFEEAVKLKEIVCKANLNFTLKIGGCEALRDLYDAKILGADTIIAPMIESPFALKKYVQSFLKVFSDEERNDINFSINIETSNSFQNLSLIINSEYIKYIKGVVVGRSDLSDSLSGNKNEVDSDKILTQTLNILKMSKEKGLVCGVGGGVTSISVSLFKNNINNFLDYFETRKVIFDFKKALSFDYKIGIEKALKFELLWLKNKKDFYYKIYKEDEERMKILEKRFS